MRIIQVIPEFGMGGAEIMCETLTYELIKSGHTVVLISLYDYHSAITDRLEKAGVKIYYLGKQPGLDVSVIAKIRKILKIERPDAIHTHRYVLQYTFPASIGMNVKIVHTVHNVANRENGFAARKLNKIFFKFFDVVPIALSDRIQSTIHAEYGISFSKIPVILNGINLINCKQKTSYEADGSFKIVHVARFSPQKNHMRLLSSFKVFNDAHPDSVLWLIGDGEKRAEAEQYVKENGLLEKVVFFGVQNCVYQYLHDADIFTLPSDYEGIPITLIEAMGTGLPIVATAVGGVPDMIKDGTSGLLCDTDEKSIADCFSRFYGDPVLREKCGKTALKESVRFSSAKMAEHYLSIYSKG